MKQWDRPEKADRYLLSAYRFPSWLDGVERWNALCRLSSHGTSDIVSGSGHRLKEGMGREAAGQLKAQGPTSSPDTQPHNHRRQNCPPYVKERRSSYA